MEFRNGPCSVCGSQPQFGSTHLYSAEFNDGTLRESAMHIDRLLRAMIQFKASDLHVQTGSPPMLRINNDITALDLPVGRAGGRRRSGTEFRHRESAQGN